MRSTATSRTPIHIVRVGNGDNVSGDGDTLSFSQAGAKQTFLGDSYAWAYSARGDAFTMQGHSHGGNDIMAAGDFVGISGSGSPEATSDASIATLFDGGVTYAGDAETMSGYALGGNDTLVGGRDSVEQFMGDAMWMGDSTKGGNDVIHLGTVDIARTVDHAALGDAYGMGGSAHGGNDVIFGADVSTSGGHETESVNLLAGDAWEMDQHAAGGADRVTGGNVVYNGAEATVEDGGTAAVLNYIAGDALFAGEGSAPVFGNDVLTGGDADAEDGYAVAENLMAGDILLFNSQGGMTFGADTLYGGSGSGNALVYNIMAGDNGFALGVAAPHGAGALPGLAASPDAGASDVHVAEVYGNDKLYGGNSQAQNEMAGDAQSLLAGDRGGNDLLVAGTGANTENLLLGDASWIQAGATGGNDTLVSGMGNDEMWGDAFENEGTGGADTFVFGLHNGQDTIHDFQVGLDHINLHGLRSDVRAPHTFYALQQHMVQVEDGVIIFLSSEATPGVVPESTDLIHIIGVTLHDLTASSFIF